MTKHILLASLLFFGARAMAQDSSPVIPELLPAYKASIDTGEGNKMMKVAKFVFDTSVDGGTVGAKRLGVFLPAGALLKQSWFYVNTQFTDSGTGTVALSCEDANNIYSAADITGISAGTITAGAQTGAAAAMTAGIAAACEITATVGGATTSGKLTGFVEYVTIN